MSFFLDAELIFRRLFAQWEAETEKWMAEQEWHWRHRQARERAQVVILGTQKQRHAEKQARKLRHKRAQVDTRNANRRAQRKLRR